MVEKEPVLAPFVLTQNDQNITPAAVGVPDIWTDMWAYRVPNGVGIVLQAADTISCYLSVGVTECDLWDCQVRIEVRDAAQETTELVYGPALYRRVQEFTNRNTMARLGVPEPVKVYARQWIVIAVRDDGAITIADAYFALVTSKVAIPL